MLPRFPASLFKPHALVMVLALTVCGCGDGGKTYQFYPVKGHVVRGGKPLTGGMIQFSKVDDPNFLASSPIAQDGSFNLQTSTTKPARTVAGAPEGKYQVTIRPPQEGTQTLPLTTAPDTYIVNPADNDITVKLR